MHNYLNEISTYSKDMTYMLSRVYSRIILHGLLIQPVAINQHTLQCDLRKESMALSITSYSISDRSGSMDSINDNLTTNQSQHKRSLRTISVNCRSLILSNQHQT